MQFSRMIWIGLVMVLTIAGVVSVGAQDTEQLLRDALAERRGEAVAGEIIVQSEVIDSWEFGTVAIPVTSGEHGGPEAYYYILRPQPVGGEVSLEHGPGFADAINNAPNGLVPSAVVNLFSGMIALDGSSQLSLPFPQGETWSFTGGPHNEYGNPNGTWSSLDFNGGSRSIVAAADGVISIPCPNWVRISHAGGWETGYYHTAGIAVTNGQTVSRGDYLGQTSEEVGCGGSAFGPHVHFTLKKNGNLYDVNGLDIGGYAVEATDHYFGCMRYIASGEKVCKTATYNPPIFNYGNIGSGGNSENPPSSPTYPIIDKGSMTVTVDYRDTIAAQTTHKYTVNVTTMPFKIDLQPLGPGLDHTLKLVNGSGRVVQEAPTSIEGRAVLYDDDIPTGTYDLFVEANTDSASGDYALTFWQGTYSLMSFEWGTGVYSNVTRHYFRCDARCNPAYIKYERMEGDFAFDYTLEERGVGAVGSGNVDGDLAYIPVQANDGIFDLLLGNTSGEGSYRLQLFQGEAPPPPSTFQVVAQPDTIEAYIGDGFTADFNVEGPDTAPEGGIKGLDMACEVSPAIVQGVEIIDGTAFSSSAIGQMLPVPDFTQGTTFRYLIAEGTDEAVVTADGKVITAGYIATQPGTATLNCVVEGLDGTLELIPEVPYVGMTINVIGSGSIGGVVTLREANGVNADIEVALLDADGQIVETVLTDATGAFLFEDLRPEAFGGTSYTLMATTPGYLKATTTTTVSVEGDQVTTVATTELIAGEVIIDGVIDLLDIVQFAADFTAQEANPTPTYDFDRDGDVNLRDYALLVRNLDATDIDWQP